MLRVTLQWIGIPSPVLQFATIVPFCSSSSLKMKETKWTQCQESLMNCWGGGVTLQWIGIPSPVFQFATNVPFCSNSSLKMKETKWTQCQESLMKCWGVQTSSTHLLFWVERIGFQPQLGHGVMTLGKKLHLTIPFFTQCYKRVVVDF